MDNTPNPSYLDHITHAISAPKSEQKIENIPAVVKSGNKVSYAELKHNGVTVRIKIFHYSLSTTLLNVIEESFKDQIVYNFFSKVGAWELIETIAKFFRASGKIAQSYALEHKLDDEFKAVFIRVHNMTMDPLKRFVDQSNDIVKYGWRLMALKGFLQGKDLKSVLDRIEQLIPKKEALKNVIMTEVGILVNNLYGSLRTALLALTEQQVHFVSLPPEYIKKLKQDSPYAQAIKNKHAITIPIDAVTRDKAFGFVTIALVAVMSFLKVHHENAIQEGKEVHEDGLESSKTAPLAAFESAVQRYITSQKLDKQLAGKS